MKRLRGRWWQPAVSLIILAVMVGVLGWVLYMPWDRTQQAMITGNVQPGSWTGGQIGSPTATPTKGPSPTPTASVVPNMPIKIYCEVTQIEIIDRRPKYDNEDYFIYATLLTRQNDLLYTRTKQIIRMQWDPGTVSIALGSTSDLRRGAVLQVSGEMDPMLLVHVGQIAVLTGHVTVVQPTPIP